MSEEGVFKKLERLERERYTTKSELKNPVIAWNDPRLTAFQEELKQWPEMRAKYEHLGGNLVAVVEQIAVEMEVALDGMYTMEDILGVMDFLTTKLRKKRGGLIVIGNM